MQESVFKYVKAIISSLFVFILLSVYIYLRRGYFDLYIANKVFAGTSLIILAIVLLIGSLGRQYNLFDPWLQYRKHLGIITFILAFLHSITTLFFLPNKFTISGLLSNYLTFGLGLTGLIFLGFLFLISFNKIIENIDRKKWWNYQVWGSRIGGVLIFFHLVLMKYPGWVKWYQIGGNDELVRPFMPPASILAGVFGLFVILVRTFELINQKFVKLLTPLLFILLVSFMGISFYIGKSNTPKALPIKWETCIHLYGSYIQESSPPKCVSIDGRSVTMLPSLDLNEDK